MPFPYWHFLLGLTSGFFVKSEEVLALSIALIYVTYQFTEWYYNGDTLEYDLTTFFAGLGVGYVVGLFI